MEDELAASATLAKSVISATESKRIAGSGGTTEQVDESNRRPYEAALPAMQRAASLLLLLLVGVCFASIADVSFPPNSVPDCPGITKSLQKCARAVTLGRSQGCQFTLTLKFGTGSELL